MIHRAPFGSLERFIAILIEHCAGNFPLWLMPDQLAILPLSEKFNSEAENILSLLNNSDIRGFVDDRNETIGKKIREAEMKKVPYMLVLGEKEISEGVVAVRKHGGEDLGKMKLEDFVELIKKEINNALEK